jgi:DNA-binding MarR family transcriptional regulator
MKDNFNIKNDIFHFLSQEEKEKFSLLSKIAKSELSKTDIKIYFTAIELAIFDQKVNPYKNSFNINQSDIARMNDMKQSNVSRSLKKIIKAELLVKNDDEFYIYHF